MIGSIRRLLMAVGVLVALSTCTAQAVTSPSLVQLAFRLTRKVAKLRHGRAAALVGSPGYGERSCRKRDLAAVASCGHAARDDRLRGVGNCRGMYGESLGASEQLSAVV